jgi:hypothetical protein
VKRFDSSRGLVRFEGFQLDLRAGELHAEGEAKSAACLSNRSESLPCCSSAPAKC